MDINIVIKTSGWSEKDLPILFGDEPVHFSDATDLPNLMKEFNIFPSTSEARRAGRKGPIPSGWTEMKGNKKSFLFIWNPTEEHPDEQVSAT